MSEATNKSIEFKSDLVEIEKLIAPLLAINAETGNITLAEGVKDISAALPEGQTLESHLEHQKVMDLINNGVELAAVKMATEAMKKNPDLQQVSYEIPSYGKSFFAGTLNRTGQSRAVGSTDVKEYKGCVSVAKHEVVSTRTKAEARSIRDYFKTLADEADL